MAYLLFLGEFLVLLLVVLLLALAGVGDRLAGLLLLLLVPCLLRLISIFFLLLLGLRLLFPTGLFCFLQDAVIFRGNGETLPRRPTAPRSSPPPSKTFSDLST